MLDRRNVIMAGAVLAGSPIAPVRAFAKPSLKMLPAQTRWTPPPAPVAVTQGLVQLANTRLWVWDTGGKGPTVVLLHPMTGSHAVWAYQQSVLAAAGYRVVGYSRRGHYQSDARAIPIVGSDTDDLTDLLAHLVIDKVHLIGCAGGAFPAVEFAQHHGERVLSLVVASSIAAVGQDRSAQAVLQRLQPPRGIDLPRDFMELSASYRAGNPGGAAIWKTLQEQAVHGPPPPFVWPAGALNPAHHPPVLVMTGDADLYFPPAVLRIVMAELVRAEFAIFAEGGHSLFWEQPDAFNALVLDFLDRNTV